MCYEYSDWAWKARVAELAKKDAGGRVAKAGANRAATRAGSGDASERAGHSPRLGYSALFRLRVLLRYPNPRRSRSLLLLSPELGFARRRAV